MLKKLAKRIEKELTQAEDYIEQAFLVRHKSKSTADLFASLSGEEIEHAEKLLKEGQNLIADDTSEVRNYLYEDCNGHDKDKVYEVKLKCIDIWEWETRFAMERVLELKYKLSQYRSMR